MVIPAAVVTLPGMIPVWLEDAAHRDGTATRAGRVELVVLVGLQGAGKSSLVARRYARTHAVVSKDHWPNARRHEQRQQRVVAELLDAGRSVVVDNANASPAERASLVRLARERGIPVRAVHVAVPFAVAAARNAARTGRAHVPAVALRRLVAPSLAEGFASVEHLDNTSARHARG